MNTNIESTGSAETLAQVATIEPMIWEINGRNRAFEVANMMASFADLLSSKKQFHIKIVFDETSSPIQHMVLVYLQHVMFLNYSSTGRSFYLVDGTTAKEHGCYVQLLSDTNWS